MRRLLHTDGKDGGQHTLFEYVLVAGLISAVAVVAVIKMSEGITLMYGDLGQLVKAVPAGW